MKKLTEEQNNITLPGEGELADKLAALERPLSPGGGRVFASPAQDRDQLYFGRRDQPGLYNTFREIKAVSGSILKINQDNMEQANRNARRRGPICIALVRRGPGIRHSAWPCF